MVRTAVVVSLLVVACNGGETTSTTGKAGGDGKAPPTKAAPPSTAMSRRAELAKTAALVVDRIGQLEAERDVTCWTSFRQLDNFIAAKSYSDFATVTKIIAAKAMVQAVWAAASAKRSEGALSAADLQAVVGELAVELAAEQQAELAKFAEDEGLQQFRDYRTTSEHWRVVLSIAQDELERPEPELRPLSPEGLDALALIATRLGLSLLKESGEIATEARTPYIEAEHVQKAYGELRTRHKIPKYEPSAYEADAKGAKGVRAALTKAIIDAKVQALRAYNKSTDDLHAELNRVSRIPLTKPAADRLEAELKSFARFLAKGFTPMRADNYLADGNFAPAKLEGRDYVDAAFVENAIMQLFPHVMLPNGDLKLSFVPRPGTISTQKLEAQEVTLLDHHMNAVRDTAFHWAVLQRVWSDEPFAMEVFAAEYVSEIVSVVTTFYLRRAQTIARQQDAKEITPEMIAKVRNPAYVMVLPQTQEAVAWGPERVAAKAKVMDGYPGPLFTDVTAAAGLPTTLPEAPPAERPGDAGFDIQKVMGSGVATGDIDGDGDADLFFTGPRLHRLYLGDGKGGFTDATEAWGITGSGVDGRGTLMVDYDGDDDLDLFVAHSHSPSQLFNNDGGKLTEVADSVGLKTGLGAHVPVWFDYDVDGDLDLYLGYYGSAACNKGECRGRNLPSLDGRNGTPNQLWRNDGERFLEVGAGAGVADVGWTLAAGAFDYDNDGDLDLALANDFGENPLLTNDGKGHFIDAAAAVGAADRGSGMNISVSDIDGNGTFDLFVSNIDMFSKTIKVVFPEDGSVVDLDDRVQRAFQYLSGNKLYAIDTEGSDGVRFEAVEGAWFEPGDRGWGWAAPFFDYEGDGDEDLYLANGWIPGSPADKQRNQMFVRDGDTFYVAPESSGEAFAGNSRGVALLDADGDGDTDLAVAGYEEPPRLLRNEQKGGAFVGVRLSAPGNTRGVGAVIELAAPGLPVQRRVVTCGVGYLGQDDGVARFGVGKAKRVSLVVRWPDGRKTKREGVAAGEVIVVSAD
ncbi:MAG: CRTAC1 family protein [Myxococcota bacterium]